MPQAVNAQTRQLDKINNLLEDLDLSDQQTHCHASEFAFKAPKHFIQNIRLQDSNDPLLLQILPVNAELEQHKDYHSDPVGDLHKNPLPSLIHKYHGRVLLIASPKCDIHCRYCFRRHFPYEQHSNRNHWQEALQYIAADDSIHEVILSGGDPMSLSEKVMLELCQMIAQIPHIKTLRIHSRTPIVAPEKAAQNEWLMWVEQSSLQIVVVVHCNHANELSEQSKNLMQRYRKANIHLLNQSVLLKNINDSVDVLETLSHQLFAQGVMPYYLHQLDKVAGAAHFQVDDAEAKTLINRLRTRLPGYLVPQLVQEIAGEPNKTPL